MALATFKDLCMDAHDAAALGAFWGAVLGLDVQPCAPDGNGDVQLLGPTSGHTIWVNLVPEAKTTKHRLHLDVNASSVAEVEALGATVLDDSFPWTVMTDPEGGEFCVFVREGPVTQRLYELGLDSGNSSEACHRIASWWAEVLGARLVDDERGYSYLDQIPHAPFESLDLVPVPEAKTTKNRIHLDVTTTDLAALVTAGAVVLRPRDEQVRWTVLADPDGNEFCAFVEEPAS